jgi:putative transposase
MPFIKIMIHAVWGTKNRFPFLVKEKRRVLIEHIKQDALDKKIYIDCMDGHTDHLHALISLGGTQHISGVMNQIKGGSSFWINNKSGLFKQHFEWADEYFAVSVSESQLHKVRNYIHNQEEHHKKVTFAEEYEDFVKKYGFKLG